ncbi:MAG: hypothetical protein HYX69_18905 [Planctomycetia bacterium]|nr:hypothetical protein [Planctomycetia bacterium]
MRSRYVAWGLLAVLLVARSAVSAPPWSKLDLFRHIEADPQQDYPLTDRNGPWVIMAATFSGPNAQDQARELVHELRSRYKLPAYTHAMHFDYRDPGGKDQFGGQRRVRYRVNELNEIAVLVGDYPSVDEPAAQKTLDKLKYAHPDCLDWEKRAKEGKTDSRSLGRLRLIQQAVLPDGNQRKQKGPMGHAFITTNPLVPDEYFVPKGIDKLVLEMNEPVQFSLLNCPSKYTLKVATFTGRVLVDPKQIAAAQKSKNVDSQLAEAADKAHRLTMALRQKGYEAYEFHDRYASIVTVGSFDSLGSPREDGKIEINPQLHALMQTFGADRFAGNGQASPQVGNPRSEAGVPLDIQPLPVEVPKRSIGSQYERPALTRR